MASFVRKNPITFKCSFFVPGQPASVQPTSVSMVLRFKNTNGTPTQVTIALTSSGATPTPPTPAYQWSGQWDSSAAQEGTVYWTAYASGTVQASDQGSFVIDANPSNNF